MSLLNAGTFASGFPKLAEDASLAERLLYGLKVAGIGMLVVFLVLIIIMAILYVFKLVALSKSKAPAAAAAPAAPTASAAPAAPAASAAAPSVSSAPSAEEELVVAIATAAIAASRGAGSCAFKVVSVTKIQ